MDSALRDFCSANVSSFGGDSVELVPYVVKDWALISNRDTVYFFMSPLNIAFFFKRIVMELPLGDYQDAMFNLAIDERNYVKDVPAWVIAKGYGLEPAFGLTATSRIDATLTGCEAFTGVFRVALCGSVLRVYDNKRVMRNA